MTRTILATAAALAAASMLASGAQACISCEYVPEVVRNSSTLPHTGHYYSAHSYSSNKARSAVVAKRRIAKAAIADKPAKLAKVDRDEKAAKVAKSEADEPVKVAKDDAAEKQVAAKPAQSESSSITVAAADVVEKVAKAPVAKEAGAKPTDCKKFFASVGMTLTVPCE